MLVIIVAYNHYVEYTKMPNISDQPQRAAALNPNESFIVQAPAGSGKTELLTQRYLTLLSRVDQYPEEIIAITFTKKAAAEMRQRILENLEKAKQPPPTEDHAKLTWQLANAVLQRDKQASWNLVENPNRLRILTIDALCASITRQMPILSQFGSHPEVSSDPEELYIKASERLLLQIEADLPWQQDIATLLLHLDNNLTKITKLLVDMLKARDQWLPHLTSNVEQLKLNLEQALGNIATEIIEDLTGCFDYGAGDDLVKLINFAVSQLAVLNPDAELIQLSELQYLPELNIENINSWQLIANFLLTKSYGWRKRFTKNEGFPAPSNAKNKIDKETFSQMKADIQDLIERLQQVPELQAKLTALLNCPPTHYTDYQWQIIQALMNLLPILVAELTLLFQEQGVVDFIEIANRAILALGEIDNPSDLALRLDYKIQHILLDEFQDTSVTQYRLLEKLISGWQAGDGRTLFLVGDPMQSIYRFRQAEVGLFMRTWQHGIADTELTPLRLTANFRSTPEIIDWINAKFVNIFPQHENISLGAVQYNHSIAARSVKPGSEVCYHALYKDQNSQANSILEIIRQTWSADPNATIAVLVKARSHLLEILPYLTAADLSYQAIEIEALAARPIVQDLLALTRAYCHPADRLAWLAVLRAPYCGLQLNDLYILSQETTCIWSQLENYTNLDLSADAKQRLELLVPLFKHYLDHRQRGELREVLEKLFFALGAQNLECYAQQLLDAKAYFDLLSQLEAVNNNLDLDYLETKVAQLYAKPNSSANPQLQIMTIHKSKGLEFDTVILPGLERRGANDQPPLLAWAERTKEYGDSDLLLAPIKAVGDDTYMVYKYIRDLNQQKLSYENQRLFYVAATRAKANLHLIASVTPAEELKPNPGSMLVDLWDDFSKQYADCVPQELDTEIETLEYAIPKLQRLAIHDFLDLHKGHEDEYGYIQNPGTSKILQLNPGYQAEIGTVIHRYLQEIAEKGIDTYANMDWQQHREAIATSLQLNGVAKSQLDNAVNLVIQALENSLTCPKGQWILSPHTIQACELAITTYNNEQIENYILDRTFIDEQQRRWIIDYKSSQPGEESLEEFLLEQKSKYYHQLQNYAAAMQLQDTHTIHLGLYFPLAQAWLEWEYSDTKDEIYAS